MLLYFIKDVIKNLLLSLFVLCVQSHVTLLVTGLLLLVYGVRM